MDFTIRQYSELLNSIKEAKYQFQTMEDFIQNPFLKTVVLRHDVDERPENALKMAKAEYDMGIKATYYFRIVKISNNPEVIKEIVALGHEVGYHYEDYALSNGNLAEAFKSFKENLAYFRTFYPVKTVCMHGSSMSDFDNRILWKHYKLSDLNIIGEPYLSIDYSDVFYLTDTGRCWDGHKYNVRDSVTNNFPYSFSQTSGIIKAFKNGQLPNRIILQSHTLWTDSILEWLWLEFREKARNNIKVIILKIPFVKKITYKLIKKYSG